MKTHYSWGLRTYVCSSILATVVIAALDPGSQHRGIMDEDGHGGVIAISLLALVTLLGLVDVLINDLMPHRFSLRCTHRHRHVIFMVLAIGQVAMALVEARGDEMRPVMIRYLLDAFMALLVACMGVYGHYWETKRKDEVIQ